MGKINILDEILIRKIAAGEVVERPASVVKELLENSIDANATKIFVEVNEGGKSLIKVTDNGDGMDDNDALLAVERHTTSKLKDVKDLFNINSLGFRGEAIASMAVVSKLRLRTKQENTVGGFEVQVHGGKVKKAENVGCPKGTIVDIEELFYNVPARKKFLKDISVELRHIIDIVTRYALNYPEIFFRLNHNGKVLLNCPSTTNTFSNIVNIYGGSTSKKLVPINYSNGEIEVIGYISKPELTRADKSHQSIFINGRYIKNKIINEGIYEAYHTMLPIDRHPLYILNINIDPTKIDVNVHPTKKEIRLSKEREIRQMIRDAIIQGLNEIDLTATVGEDDSLMSPAGEIESKETQQPIIEKEEIKQESADYSVSQPQSQQRTKYDLVKDKQEYLGDLDTDEPEDDFVVIGQLNKTYILVEDNGGLMIVDQHVVEERHIYEMLMERYKDNSVQRQELLKPIILDLSPTDKTIITNNNQIFKELGFDIEEFGLDSFVVRSTPLIMGKQQNEEMILDIIDELDTSDTSVSLEIIKENIIIRMACRAALKAGSELTTPQMRDLIRKVIKMKDDQGNYTCPHGRPIVIKIPIKELEKKFKRA
ncbi:DNA mismatch repair endonuclease MutL [Nanoarchaeota archaeon]